MKPVEAELRERSVGEWGRWGGRLGRGGGVISTVYLSESIRDSMKINDGYWSTVFSKRTVHSVVPILANLDSFWTLWKK